MVRIVGLVVVVTSVFLASCASVPQTIPDELVKERLKEVREGQIKEVLR